MYDFHGNKEVYFHYQYLTAREYIIPFIKQHKAQSEVRHVLEIGCGEAGVLKAFLEIGCKCVGIELSAHRVQTAERLHAEAVAQGKISFIIRDIYDIDPEEDLPNKFDVILLKDVIEHIPHQERFIPLLKNFLNPGGVIFFGFPPWQMPFGGHQQVTKSKVLSRIPYFHLLPRSMYHGVLKLFGEPKHVQTGLLEIHDTGISIERFERIIEKSEMQILQKKLWLLNPIYKYKFRRGPYGQSGLIAGIPFVRNFLTTAAYYLIGVQKEAGTKTI